MCFVPNAVPRLQQTRRFVNPAVIPLCGLAANCRAGNACCRFSSCGRRSDRLRDKCNVRRILATVRCVIIDGVHYWTCDAHFDRPLIFFDGRSCTVCVVRSKSCGKIPIRLKWSVSVVGLGIGGVSILGQWLYFAYLESGEKQGTWGKQMLGLYVTDLTGNRVSFGRASGRVFRKNYQRTDSVGDRLHHGGDHGAETGVARHDCELPGFTALRGVLLSCG